MRPSDELRSYRSVNKIFPIRVPSFFFLKSEKLIGLSWLFPSGNEIDLIFLLVWLPGLLRLKPWPILSEFGGDTEAELHDEQYLASSSVDFLLQ